MRLLLKPNFFNLTVISSWLMSNANATNLTLLIANVNNVILLLIEDKDWWKKKIN